MSNTECPDFSSHQENARDLYLMEHRTTEDALTADDHEAIDTAAENEYRSCEGH